MNLRCCAWLSVWPYCTTITIVFERRSVGFQVVPTSTIWNTGWGSAWTHSPRASIALSTRILLDSARSYRSLTAETGQVDLYAKILDLHQTVTRLRATA